MTRCDVLARKAFQTNCIIASEIENKALQVIGVVRPVEGRAAAFLKWRLTVKALKHDQ